jgi:hypothetical protein
MAKVTAGERKFVIERAQGCCEYCWSQIDFSPSPFAIEHIIPSIKIDELSSTRRLLAHSISSWASIRLQSVGFAESNINFSIGARIW